MRSSVKGAGEGGREQISNAKKRQKRVKRGSIQGGSTISLRGLMKLMTFGG